MAESLQVQFARVDERVKTVLQNQEKDIASRKQQYEAIESLRITVIDVSNRLSEVESKLAGQAPTIEEFITIKHKVVGAGKLGHWLWIAGFALIGLVFKFRVGIGTWLIGVK